MKIPYKNKKLKKRVMKKAKKYVKSARALSKRKTFVVTPPVFSVIEAQRDIIFNKYGILKPRNEIVCELIMSTFGELAK